MFQLALVLVHPFLVALEFRLDLVQFLLIGLAQVTLLPRAEAVQTFVAVFQVAGQLGDVTDDGAHQRQARRSPRPRYSTSYPQRVD